MTKTTTKGKSKKKIPEEIKEVIEEVVKLKEETQQLKEEVQKEESPTHKEGEWDVKIGDPIPYFDKRLSYEITGYRPITETEGLNFNPEWFTEASRTFLETGKYCSFYPHSKLYDEFWNREYKRCKNGLTVNGYTITGFNYYFLNYYQLPNTDLEKAGDSRSIIFPKFFTYQYEFFHYFELCRTLRKNYSLMKNRGCK